MLKSMTHNLKKIRIRLSIMRKRISSTDRVYSKGEIANCMIPRFHWFYMIVMILWDPVDSIWFHEILIILYDSMDSTWFRWFQCYRISCFPLVMNAFSFVYFMNIFWVIIFNLSVTGSLFFVFSFSYHFSDKITIIDLY
jgi:hypothetical protein